MDKAIKFLLLLPLACLASSVTVAWNANAPDECIVLYRVYWGPELEFTTDAVETVATLTSIPSGTNWAVVTALNEVGESEPSNMISFVGAAGTIITLNLQQSANLNGPWTNLTSCSWTGTVASGFWRGKMTAE